MGMSNLNFLNNSYNSKNEIKALQSTVKQNSDDILQLNNNQTELWDYLDNQFLIDKGFNNLQSKVNYNVSLTGRNIPYTNTTLLPYTFDGRPVYQCYVKFNSNGGETNLVNGANLLYFDVSIINFDTKNLIKPEDWNLRYISESDKAIRATIPTQGNYVFICKVIPLK